MTTQEIFDKITKSHLFRTDGERIDVPQAFIDLAEAINAEEETDWNMGECAECTLSDLVVGAYCAFSEWHAGQWSPEYTALCALGGIYSPGMECAPEGDDSAHAAYAAVNYHYAQ